MESMNWMKGYGKVNPDAEDQIQTMHEKRSTASRKRLIVALAISAIFLLTLTISIIVGKAIHESITEPTESVESVQIVCQVTQHPASCFSSITSLNVPEKADGDPEFILGLSLQVSIKELKNLSSFLSSLNDVNSQAAINDCLTQFDDALSRLNDSLLVMKVSRPGDKVLTVDKVKDIQTWISAAMTDQETCLDGLSEMGSTVLDEVNAKMDRSKEFMSNSLAIVAHMQPLLEKFDRKMY
uniref:pectinesterase n=1 Tax=Rhizophora mucronata TaxID=61149 RepID=A0A2P2IIF9_RHIMU